MHSTRLIWEAAGCPAPIEANGRAIRHVKRELVSEEAPRDTDAEIDIAAEGEARRPPHCAACGVEEDGLSWIEDSISEPVTVTQATAKLWSHGGELVCRACLWCVKALYLRARPFIAWSDGKRNKGLKFFSQRGMLAELLAPPTVPFVACWPRAGVAAGGELKFVRMVQWDAAGRPLVPSGAVAALKGALHVAPFAPVNSDPTLFRLQVDDFTQVLVDVPTWRELRIVSEGAVRAVMASGLSRETALGMLKTLHVPPGTPNRSAWERCAVPLRRYQPESWWPLFVEML